MFSRGTDKGEAEVQTQRAVLTRQDRDTERLTVAGFLVTRLRSIEGVRRVVAGRSDTALHVTILIDDFWGHTRNRVYAVLNDLRRRRDASEVEVSVFPEDAVADPSADPDLEVWL